MIGRRDKLEPVGWSPETGFVAYNLCAARGKYSRGLQAAPVESVRPSDHVDDGDVKWVAAPYGLEAIYYLKRERPLSLPPSLFLFLSRFLSLLSIFVFLPLFCAHQSDIPARRRARKSSRCPAAKETLESEVINEVNWTLFRNTAPGLAPMFTFISYKF